MSEETKDNKPAQKTLRMTSNQGNYVALAQRVHNSLMAEAQALAQQSNTKRQEAELTLRQAVEGAFNEHGQQIPTAQVRIVNDEKNVPAVLVWEEAPAADAPAGESADAGENGASEEAPAEAEAAPAPAPAPVAKVAPAPTNGKAPEAAKRKLPVK